MYFLPLCFLTFSRKRTALSSFLNCLTHAGASLLLFSLITASRSVLEIPWSFIHWFLVRLNSLFSTASCIAFLSLSFFGPTG